jgi:hypothetical protein
VHCHEEAYAKYDSTTGGNPLEHFVVPKVNLEEEKTKGENLQTTKDYKEKFKSLMTSCRKDATLIVMSTSFWRKIRVKRITV